MANKKNYIINQVFDPSSEFIVHWNKLIFGVGLINFFMDPLFTYLITLNNNNVTRINVDLKIGAILAVLRTIGDLFRIFGILVKFRTAYEAPGSTVFRRKHLIEEPWKIAIRYFKSTFVIDLLAVLPLQQACLWNEILASKTASRLITDKITTYTNMFFAFWFQLLPRLFVLIYAKTDVTKMAGLLMKSAMSGAFYNLLWFVNLSNIVGALYYQMHLFWVFTCIHALEPKVDFNSLGWDQFTSNCTQNNEIEQGIFSSILTNKIGTRNFTQRFMFCFSWGLKSLSSLGQNFTTSFSTWQTTYSIIVTLYGLIFFADLITRMQAGIQSMEEREEQQRARQREINEWMYYHQLPAELKERVGHAIQTELTENFIDDEAMLDSLPIDLRSELRKYLYLDSVSKLPKFANMDAPLVEAICQHLKTFCGKDGAYIIFEGDPVKNMFFIFSGQLELSFTDRGKSNVNIIGAGDWCCQELVTWASQPTTSMDNLPSSTWTIKCLTDVEAFVLQAYEMKILATQFAYNQGFQRAFKQHYP